MGVKGEIAIDLEYLQARVKANRKLDGDRLKS